MGRKASSVDVRFWSHVERTSECWEWVGASANRGTKGRNYGVFWLGGKLEVSHRVSWVMERGPIPPGMLVCHRCDNPPCVRPDHLFLGTPTDNMQDMIAKGRAAWRSPAPSLVRFWGELFSGGMPVEVIAKRQAVSATTVRRALADRVIAESMRRTAVAS